MGPNVIVVAPTSAAPLPLVAAGVDRDLAVREDERGLDVRGHRRDGLVEDETLDHPDGSLEREVRLRDHLVGGRDGDPVLDQGQGVALQRDGGAVDEGGDPLDSSRGSSQAISVVTMAPTLSLPSVMGVGPAHLVAACRMPSVPASKRRAISEPLTGSWPWDPGDDVGVGVQVGGREARRRGRCGGCRGCGGRGWRRTVSGPSCRPQQPRRRPAKGRGRGRSACVFTLWRDGRTWRNPEPPRPRRRGMAPGSLRSLPRGMAGVAP